MSENTITSFVSAGAMRELERAKELVDEISASDVVRLKTLCEAAELLRYTYLEGSTKLSNAYTEFAVAALQKAKDML